MSKLNELLLDPTETPDGIKTGDATNNVELNKTQGKRYNGTSTVWKDMIGDLFGRRLLSQVGKVDYDYENNCLDFASGGSISNANDRVGANLEINHEFKVGLSIPFYLHAHWFQEVVSHTPDVLDTTAYELTVRWRIVRNGYGINLTTPSWTTITITSGVDNVFDATNLNGEEYMGQLTRASEAKTVDCDISDTFQIQLARTDSLGGVMKVYFIDDHGAVDSDGSDEEMSKT